MKKTTEDLAVGMANLSNAQLKNLKYHLEKQTPIVCGKDALKFTTESGCGCPATLASLRRVPKQDVDLSAYLPNSVARAWDRLSPGCDTEFLQALKKSKPADVRRAIKKVLELRGI